MHLNNRKSVLVVIDMQPKFFASNKPELLNAVAAEMIAAKERGEPIVVLEVQEVHKPWTISRTHQRLLDILEDPDCTFAIRIKWTEDGSQRVLHALDKLELDATHFRLCGVNTGACVRATAMGLIKAKPEYTVQVLVHAVNDDDFHPWRRYEGLDERIQFSQPINFWARSPHQ